MRFKNRRRGFRGRSRPGRRRRRKFITTARGGIRF